jgi:hypothetical protein
MNPLPQKKERKEEINKLKEDKTLKKNLNANNND